MTGSRPAVDAVRESRPGHVIAAGVASTAAGLLAVAVLVASIQGEAVDVFGGSGAAAASGRSLAARRDIPASYLRLYQQAGQTYGIDWALLAGIGRVECDHGRDPDPSCTREGAVNSAGAGGPMQFLAPTWARYGVDGNGDGRADRWEPADAVYGAANYLRASGAPAHTEAAIYAYNHAGWYVADVQRWASLYRGDTPRSPAAQDGLAPDLAAGLLQSRSPSPVFFAPSGNARLAPDDGHLALVPTAAPLPVQAMVVAGNELQDLRYGPGGHPDPRGSTEQDCSSSVNYVLYRSGVRPIAEIVRENPLAQDYVSWGEPGPGRWVTIYAARVPTAHVFILIAGLRLDTSHGGTDVGPNRGEDGPRWRVLGHIPTWANWSVRHPPGL